MARFPTADGKYHALLEGFLRIAPQDSQNTGFAQTARESACGSALSGLDRWMAKGPPMRNAVVDASFSQRGLLAAGAADPSPSSPP